MGAASTVRRGCTLDTFATTHRSRDEKVVFHNRFELWVGHYAMLVRTNDQVPQLTATGGAVSEGPAERDDLPEMSFRGTRPSRSWENDAHMTDDHLGR